MVDKVGCEGIYGTPYDRFPKESIVKRKGNTD